MFEKNHSKENTKAVVGSTIIAKAVSQRNNGRYEIIVVFQKSTRQEFYWIFQAKSARTPKRAWKFAGYAARDISFNDHKAYQDISSFVATRTAANHAAVLSVRVLQRRLLASLQTKVEHESIYADWTVDSRPAEAVTYELVGRRIRNARRGRMAIFS